MPPEKSISIGNGPIRHNGTCGGGRNYPLNVKVSLEERELLRRRSRRQNRSIAEIIRTEGIDQAVGDERAQVAEELDPDL